MTISLWNIFKAINIRIDLIIVKEIGIQSLLYVCTNQFILNILVRLPLPEIYGVVLYIWHIAEVVIIMVSCFIVNRLIMKTPLKLILGK